MKFPVYITLSVIIGIATMQAASAQEGKTARFDFAPNKWKTDSGNVPKGYGDHFEPQHNVQAGSVPTNDILGVDPTMLAKPAPLPVATTRLTPQLMVPKTNANPNFNPAFGKPTIAQLPVPIVPQQAVALPVAPIKQAAAIPAQAARPVVRTAVQGVLKKPVLRSTRPASAAPAIASYPTNFGYVPGQMLTHNSSGNTHAIAELRGQLLHPTKSIHN